MSMLNIRQFQPQVFFFCERAAALACLDTCWLDLDRGSHGIPPSRKRAKIACRHGRRSQQKDLLSAPVSVEIYSID